MAKIAGRTRRAFLGGGIAMIGATAAAARSAPGGGAAPLSLRSGLDQDQTPAVQRALAAAAGEGRPVQLPPGRFRIGGLDLPPGTRLVGAGAGSTTLVQSSAQPMLTARGGPVALRDMTLEGSLGTDRATPIASFADIGGLEILGVAATRTRGTALRLERCGGRVEGSSVSDADIAIFSLDAAGLQIVGNIIDRCANNGIQVWRSQKGHDGTQVLGNRISSIRTDAGGSGQNGNGINVFRAGGVIVAQNAIRDCAFTAVRNNGGDNVQILGNSCTNLGEVAIYAEFAFEGCIIANNLVDRASTGVSMTNFNEKGRLAVASGNLLRNLFRRRDPDRGTYHGGTGIAVEADASVTGNVVEGVEFAGIAIGLGQYQRDVVCANNVVRRAAYGITASVVPGSGTAQITGNLLAECSQGRIVGFEFDKVVSGDLGDGGDRRFPHVAVHGNMAR